ncbi:MAG: lamin tail domain-containing protein [Chthonomonadaceae bacterium]|nr:lamin tail domain-containing protein [Chthonomonadaceae bacterium]
MNITRTRRTGLLSFAVATVALAGGSLSAQAQLVISQIYGGGGSGLQQAFKTDGIELFNNGTTAVNVSGYSVQYASATGNFNGIINLPAVSIAAGGYFLISTGTVGAGAGNDLASFADLAGSTVSLSGTAGKVALVNTTTSLGTVTNPPTGTTVLDFVGYGATASAFEGAGPAPAPANITSSIVRNFVGGVYVDTNNNSTEFVNSRPVVFHKSTGATIQGQVPSPSALLPFAMGVPMLAMKLRKRRK